MILDFALRSFASSRLVAKRSAKNSLLQHEKIFLATEKPHTPSMSRWMGITVTRVTQREATAFVLDLCLPVGRFNLSGVLRAMVSRVFFNKDLAQTNSVARMASPSGMTTTAGPGKTIIAMPISNTVKPPIATKTFLINPTVNVIGICR